MSDAPLRVRQRKLHRALRVPHATGGCGRLLATLTRRGHRDVRVMWTVRRRMPFALILRIAQHDVDGTLTAIDVSAWRLEALRDAIDDAIARRDAIRTELGALADDTADDADESTDSDTDHAPACFPGASSAAPSSRAALSPAHGDGPILFEDTDP